MFSSGWGRSRVARSFLLTACGTAALLALAACSSGSGSGSSGSSGTGNNAALGLLDRLPQATGVQGSAAVVNVVQVRSLLKLPADASPVSATNAVDQRYANLLGVAVPQLESPYTGPAQVMAAINFGQVTAAAGNGIGTVVVLATTQPFAQIADKLTAAGYSRSGDLLSMPAGRTPGEIPAIAGTQGFLALGTDPATVQAVAEGHAKGITGPVRDELASLNSPVAEAVPLTGSCLTGFAMSDDISGDAGRFLITTNNPQANRLTLGNVTSILHEQPGTPTVSGNQLTVPYTYKPSDGVSPLDSLGELPIAQVYRCS